MNVIAATISLVLFVGGIWVMGSAFYVPGLEPILFLGGILMSTLGIAIPVHVTKRIDG